MLIVWLVVCELLLVMKLVGHTWQQNCCVYVSTHANYVVTIVCLNVDEIDDLLSFELY